MMAALGAGLVLGAIGSAHCAVMCGPLAAVALPRGSAGAGRLTRHALLYNAGRLTTYVLLGVIAGSGGGLLARAGFGRAVAMLAAAGLVAQAWIAWRHGRGGAPSGFGRGVTRALARAGGFMRRHERAGAMLFGGLTGLLPCGLVYAALTAAAGFGHPRDAAALMGAFGLATSPALVAVALAGQFTSRVAGLRRAAPAVLLALAVVLVFRSEHQHPRAASGHASQHGMNHR